MNFEDYCNLRKKEYIGKNITNLFNDINTDNFEIKLLSQYQSSFYYFFDSFEKFKTYIIDKIKSNDALAIQMFMKNISRQNFYEKMQIEYINTYCLDDIKNMFNITTDIKFIKNYTLKFNDSKTFDFIDNQHKILLACKHINQNGGSQDNQLNDLLMFNRQYEDYKTLLVISGKYGTSKMKNIKINKNVFILFLDDKYNSSMIHNTQHFSSNSELIKYLDLSFIDGKIIEPFYGNGDLEQITQLTFDEKYDIDNSKNCIHQDTLLNPPNYNDNFVITNPPYLAKNKLTKDLKSKYQHLMNKDINDIYQIFINQIIDNNVKGGLLIIPINFLFGSETIAIRNKFLSHYNLITVNIFEKQMFKNTTQSVIVFTFTKTNLEIQTQYNLFTKTETIENINIDFSKYENLLKKSSNKIKIKRYCKESENVSHIKIILIDNIKDKIRAVYDDNPTINKISDRTFMNLIIEKELTKEDEINIIEHFNNKLNEIRTNTYSLIFSSYRENDRKRLDINAAINLLKNIIEDIIE